MPKCRMYTQERLRRINTVYLSDYSHEIRKSDVRFANRCVKMMYNTLGADKPRVGDIIQYTTREGIYYPHAHLDSIENDRVSVCLNPFVPFVFMQDGAVHFNAVSGGPFVRISSSMLKKAGVESKWARFFGSAGVCAHGAIDFEGYASCWEYKEEGLLFGEYSTRLYNRTVFRKIEGKWYITEATDAESVPNSLPNKEDFNRWLEETKAVHFGDFAKDEVVTVFSYKEKHFLVPLDYWESLSLPQSKRRINGQSYVSVKLNTDDNSKVVSIYRYANN